MRDLTMHLLYSLSELNGYGKFLVANCRQEVVQMLADNLLQAKNWLEKKDRVDQAQ